MSTRWREQAPVRHSFCMLMKAAARFTQEAAMTNFMAVTTTTTFTATVVMMFYGDIQATMC